MENPPCHALSRPGARGSADDRHRGFAAQPYPRDVADYPEPGVVFKDITPLLADRAASPRSPTPMAGPPSAPVPRRSSAWRPGASSSPPRSPSARASASSPYARRASSPEPPSAQPGVRVRPNVDSLSREPERILEVEWAPTQSSVFLVAIQVEALDRSRLLSDVTRVLSDQHVNILSAAVQTSRDRVATSRFTFEMGDPKHLGHVLKAVRGVEGVYDVYRVTSAGNRS
ncbi:hypothetical protein SGLAM104S_00691 [Streptomyces glaucescens]